MPKWPNMQKIIFDLSSKIKSANVDKNEPTEINVDINRCHDVTDDLSPYFNPSNSVILTLS